MPNFLLAPFELHVGLSIAGGALIRTCPAGMSAGCH
jgi:hypothetical protein